MNKDEIQNFLGDAFVVKTIIENEEELFAFYVSKKFEESGGNDNYILVGLGPFYFNKLSGEKRRLGAAEFHEEYFDRKLVQDNLIEEHEQLSLEEVIKKIKKRKHINGDEFEIIMDELQIDHLEITIWSNDMIHEIIESENPDFINKFKSVFDKAELEITHYAPNKIIFKNE